MNEELKILKQAVDISPENIMLRLYYLECLVEKGADCNEIFQECKKLVECGSNNKQVLLTTGKTYFRFQHYEKAIHCFSIALSLPNLTKMEKAEAHQYLGDCYLQIEETDKAFKEWEKAREYWPEEKRSKEERSRSADLLLSEEDEKKEEEDSAILSLATGTMYTTVSSIPFERSEINFEHVAGLETLKEHLRLKIILPFQRPDIYRIYGKKAGGGILLYGPPGCGKTLIAKAVAGECEANFISIGISDILDMWHGNTEKNIKAIFEKARKSAPCIIFFDEMEAVGGNRKDMQQHFQRVITDEFLTQMDGIGSRNENVLVIAATNVPWNIDPALKRPGRFDRIIFVPPPDMAARIAILKMYLKDKPTENIDVEKIAKKTEYFSGADLENLVDMAVEKVLTRVIRENKVIKICTLDLLDCLKEINPSTLEWLQIAKNYAEYANRSGFYDEVVKFFKQNPKLL